MKTKRYKILALSDLKGSPEKLIESTVNLANRINGDIEFFHVKKPNDLVNKENQINAIRNIKDEYKLADKQLEQLINNFSKNQKTSYQVAIGNVKNEIEAHIKKTNPDIIVLGKRNANALSIFGDNITAFVLKNYQGSIFIASEDKIFNQNEELSVGLLNNDSKPIELAHSFVENSKKPIKSFKIKEGLSLKKDTNLSSKKGDVIEYVFEKHANVFTNISNYLTKSKVDLFCIHRGESNNGKGFNKTEIANMVSKFNVSLLISG